MESIQIESIPDFLTFSYLDAMKRWRRKYAPGSDQSLLFSQYIASYEVKLQRDRSGIYTIIVEIRGHNPGTDEVFFYRGHQAGNQLSLYTLGT